MAFTFYKQFDSNDCGPTCIKMVVKYYGKNISIQALRQLCNIEREGTSINTLRNTAEKIGFTVLTIKATLKQLNTLPNIPYLEEIKLPAICFWNENHFVVIYKVKNNIAYIADPAVGKIKLHVSELATKLYGDRDFAKVILLEPNTPFHSADNSYYKTNLLKSKLTFINKYLLLAKQSITVLLLLLLLQLLFQSVSPYLTQQSFDSGILQKNIGVIYKIIIVQVIIFILSAFFSYIISIVSNKISYKVSVSLTADFIKKISKIPINYFNQKKSTDFIQRFFDLNRIESFLSYNLTHLVLSLLSLFVLSALIIYYNFVVFSLFFVFTFAYLIWLNFSTKRNRELDSNKFDLQILNFNTINEYIEGINEIKLSGREDVKIKSFLTVETKRFELNLKNIKVSQLYTFGSSLINNLGLNIITLYISFLTINNTITIGQLAAIQLIINQLNGITSSIFNSIVNIQDIKFSLERILEIHEIAEEKDGSEKLNNVSEIQFDSVTYNYTTLSNPIIANLNLSIPTFKTTAIVGKSGSGKTTLMKLMLGFLEPTQGHILINNKAIDQYEIKEWRKKCGAILQDSYIFTDTILNNVCEWDENVNFEKYENALKLTAIFDFIVSLPITHQTIIGRSGLQLSSGQKQRILLARMFYKNPDFIFLDEATNNLDSETEKIIIDNLNKTFKNKTKIIIAHRLNTIKNADNIIVLDKGCIIESGTHNELIKKNGYYLQLIKEQFESNVST